MRKDFFYKHLLMSCLCLATGSVAAQTKLEGYVFEQNNRGFLNQVNISIRSLDGSTAPQTAQTNLYGLFNAVLSPGTYTVTAEKDIFFERTDTLVVSAGQTKAFLKMEMRRRPGYLFDATLAEMREAPDQSVDAIQGARIEVYNRTIKKNELFIENDPDAFFQFTFERGHHYTILIRKEGYLAKRIEVYVNINGCILCIDGVRTVSPGVTENLTAGHEMGTLLANIELEKAKLDKRIQIQNIYYDYDKWDIRPDASTQLDQVTQLLKDNPGLSVELGSHTDSRGNDEYNDQLSLRRAQSAVAYIIGEGIDSTRITAHGYGERALVNHCSNGVECTEGEHQQNRRTELRITGIAKLRNQKSLEQMVIDEETQWAVKGKAPKLRRSDQQLPEANNSVRLEQPTGSSTQQVLYEYEQVRILPLPDQFKGYAIELLIQPYEASADAAVFQKQKEVFYLLQSDGRYAYFLVNLGSRDAAINYFKKQIKADHPQARLVLFGAAGKSYLE